MREEFSAELKQALARRVGMRCSNPECRAATSGPRSDVTKAVNIGVAAHLAAASPGGPRYDPSLTPEQRCCVENGIWLCQNCGKLIDNDPQGFPADLLRRWKADAEERARSALGARSDSVSPSEVNAAVFIQGPNAINISGPNAVHLGPNAIKIVGPIVRKDGS
jgi:hypothetical protein